MASSGNFSTFNPSDNATTSGYGDCTLANGNCKGTGASTGHFALASTIATGNTGKYYAEFYLVTTDGGAWVGYYSSQQTVTMITASNKWVPNTGVTWNPANLASYFQDGDLYKDGSTTSSWGSTFAATDIIQIAIDADNDAVYYGKNNTWQNSGNPESGASKTGAARTSIPKNVLPAVGMAIGGSSTATWIANFGQDSTFGGTISAGGNADANGFGDFKYAPPSGYVALSTANVPVSDDIDPAQTDDDIPTKQFNTILYTGNSTTGQSITGVGFKPDLIWAKMYTSSQNNQLYDSVRLNSGSRPNGLRSDTTGAEFDDTSTGNNNPIISSFDTDGFTLGTSGSGPNDNARGYLAWCWRANGGTTTTDTSGDISTVRQSNVAGGFAILTWTGNGSNNQRLPHGLGKKPGLVIAKRRDSAQSWGVWTQLLGDNSKEMQLESSSGWQNSSNAWYQSGMTTDFVGIGSDRNISSSTNVAYVWTDIEGYSRFGNYTGNGNADGPFIYTGFRPRMIFFKWYETAATAEPWGVFDTARVTYNPTSEHSYSQVYWNTTAAASQGSTHGVDFLSNGVKLRGTGGLNNASGGKYIYGAWGDVPFKYNNTF